MAARCGVKEPNRRGSIRTGILAVEPISISPKSISIHPSHRLPIEPGDSSDDSSCTPPPLKFYSLANKRGSHGSTQQPSLFLLPMDNAHTDHRVSPQLVQNGRRESFQLIGRSNGDVPWYQSPSSPVEHRRTSIASSSSPQTAFSQRSHNPRRRPSSSSSAISISTLRPHSPSTFTASGFGNGLKLPPRQSSLSSLHTAPTFTPGFTPGQAPPVSPTTSPDSIDPLTVLPVPQSSSSSSSDIQDFRFGSVPTSTHLTGRFPRKLSQDERSLDSPTGEDEEMNDRAREKFRQQLLNAGLSSISISLPTVPLGSNVRSRQSPSGFSPLQTPLSPSFFEPTTSPFITSHAPSPSVPLSTPSPSAYSSVTVSPRAETANGRRQSASYFGSVSYNRNTLRPPSDALPKLTSPNDDSGHSGDDEAEEDRPISPLRTRNSLRMLDVKRLTRDKRVLQPEDNDGSGIEDESDSDGSRHETEGLRYPNQSSSLSRQTDVLKPSFDLDKVPSPPPFGTFTFGSGPESQSRSRPFPFDKDLPLSTPPSPLHSPKSLTLLSSFDSHSQPPQPTLPSDLTDNDSHPEIMILPNTPRLNSSYTSPERTPINNALRRPSLSPSVRSPTYTLKEGHPDLSSNILNSNTQRSSSPPPRSLSDSAVPRRPSLAAEVGVILPPTLARASVGALSDDVEWDMNFILSDTSLPSVGNDLLDGSSRRDSLAGMRALSSMISPFGSPPEIDSFAEFVQDHDPLFNKTRLAWTLSRVPSTTTGWSFPATGGYTILDFPSDPTASSTGSYSISSGSATSFPFAQQPHRFQNRPVDSIIRGNRPPSPSWGLRRKGKGWGIIPFQDSRTEIKFGPKGKWRAEGGRSRPLSRGADNHGLPKATDEARKRQGLPRTSMTTDSAAESRLNSRSQSWAEEREEDITRTGPIPSDGTRVTFEDDYISTSGTKDSLPSGPSSSSSSSIKPRSIKSSGQGDRSKPIPIQSDPYSYASSSISAGRSSGSTPRTTEISSPPIRSLEKTKSTEKAKKTAKWLLTLKQAGAALGSSSSSSNHTGGGGGKKQSWEPDQPTGNYIPPWMSAGTTGRKEETGLASKFKFKRRSISDGRRNSREKASFSGGEDSSGISLRSRRGFETDDETDDGEAREGKAWEDVPTEALAMVIPLSAVPSSTTTTTTDPVRSASSAADTNSSRSAGSSSSEFVNHTSRWSRPSSPNFSFDGVSPLAETNGSGETPNLDPRSKTTTTASATASASVSTAATTNGGLKVAPPPPENSLLVYFVPFGDGHLLPSLSESPTNPSSGPSKLFSQMRLKRHPSQMFHRSTPSSGLKPSSQGSTRYQQSSYPSHQQPSQFFQPQDARSPTFLQPPSSFSAAYIQSFSLPSGPLTHPGGIPMTDSRPGSIISPFSNSMSSFSSFRIVARVVDPSDLTFIPSWPSWESQQNPSLHAAPEVKLSEPGTNPETSVKDSRTGRNDPTVVGVCHGFDHGVEFVREGWERLGFVPASMNEEKAETNRVDLDENLESRLLGILGCLSTACVAIMNSTTN